MNNLTNYGFVYFDTHGSGGRWILTGQIVDPNDNYDLLMREGKVRIYTNILYHDYLITKFDKYDHMYAISNNYISSLDGTSASKILSKPASGLCRTSPSGVNSNLLL